MLRPCREKDVRRYTVRGHAVDVIPSDQDQWGVTVDGTEVGARFTTSQSAWAAIAVAMTGTPLPPLP
jgi:hypothetical protein